MLCPKRRARIKNQRATALDDFVGGKVELTRKRRFKRLVDLLGASLALVVLLPLLAFISLTILVTMGRPVLFRQVRAGCLGQPFHLLKFRTMSRTRDATGRLLPDGERLTSVGRFLRQYSLDELPQLWNIWVGDMSFVGPRPLLVNYLLRYSPEQARRHEVKPGLTGWAQVNGRNALSWGQRFHLDVWYVDHWSLGLDARIVSKTFQKIFQREGISLEGHATMPEFTGNDEKVS